MGPGAVSGSPYEGWLDAIPGVVMVTTLFLNFDFHLLIFYS
jgi:hypothetical protein